MNANDATSTSAPGATTVLALDTLVAGTHFFPGAPPADIGYKALAVNLSDLAAMGAEPVAVVASIVLPAVDPRWRDALLTGLEMLADHYHVPVTHKLESGPVLVVTAQVQGRVPPAEALCRRGARAGDHVWVSGTVGDAGLALAALEGRVCLSGEARAWVEQRLARPVPRIGLGRLLRKHASSAIDISDGLAADLGHILESSGVGAEIEVERLPLAGQVSANVAPELARQLALEAGDDYELLWTAPPDRAAAIEAMSEAAGCRLTRIGIVTTAHGLRCLRRDGATVAVDGGYQHFR